MKYPTALGPYSPFVKVGNFIYFSGQIGLCPDTMKLETTIESQTKQVCENILGVCEAAGVEIDNIFKTTIFLAQMSDFASVNEIYGRYFQHKPARSCVAVRELPAGAKVEIECIAYK
ncbi:deaminase [Candidatus Gracilibacteria bacterium]|nr:deaminase [Candidatus Gracilibacteria bacterium]